MQREDVDFAVDGTRCAAWWYRSGDEDGRPCIVMAHGFGSTRDSGLEAFAEAFADGGFDVLLFDYRSFGASDGEPRQLVSFRRHREDYLAATAFARTLQGVDPDRIVLWGTSFSGGHVLVTAVADGRVAAVISQTPAVDLAAGVLDSVRANGPRPMVQQVAAGVRDLIGSLRGREPVHLPIVGPPGSPAVLNTPGAEAAMQEIAGPTWRNQFAAREMLGIAQNRPTTSVADLPCPALFVIGDRDDVCPPGPIEKAAFKATGRAEVRRYPMGHFDVYVEPWRSRAIADQLHFLRRHVAKAPAAPVVGGA